MERKWYRQGDELLQEIGETEPGESELLFWYIGQCGFVYKKNVIVYIDPVLNDLTDQMGCSRRYYPAPFSPEKVAADYVLCTHGHRDHLDIATLTGIAESDSHTRFIVPGDCIPALEEAGIEKGRVTEARAGEEIALPGLTVFPVSAAHPVHRKTERGADVALCYQLVMGGIRLLHLGDTYLTEQLLADLQALDVPDLFFVPINGGDYFRTARNCIGNLNAAEVAQLAVLLRAGVTVPTHYDMMKGNTVDPLAFIRALREIDTTARWRMPVLGEGVVYRRL